jgi:tellurite resistance protein TerC
MWIALALVFNAFVWAQHGPDRALEFLTGYLIEKALSVDNLFVFLLIFSYFKVPDAYQHRVLFWGILGALVMRGLFIWLGAVLLQHFEWVTYLFGVLLVLTAAKLLFSRGIDVDPQKSLALRAFRRVVPCVPEFRGARFTVIEAGRRMATPLLLVLVVVETTDVVFAVDSIPAVFGITTDPFIVYTSNIFAVLGLRALYFALAATMQRVQYLQVGLALVLAFVGVKMLLSAWWHPSAGISLGVVAGILAGAGVASAFQARRDPKPESAAADPPTHESSDETGAAEPPGA